MKFDEMVSKSKSTKKSFNTKMLFLAIIGIVGIIIVIFVFKTIFSGKEKVTVVSLDKNSRLVQSLYTTVHDFKSTSPYWMYDGESSSIIADMTEGNKMVLAYLNLKGVDFLAADDCTSLPSENANIIRYGVMHRNTFINSPQVLNPTLETRERKNLFFAGQLTGTEGYTESIATGMLAGINLARRLSGEEPLILPETTILGALTRYISNPEHTNFQPINSNWALVPPIELPKKERKNKKLKNELLSNRAIEDLQKLTSFYK